MSHAGLYKFYVTNWDGDWTLAIQIDITPVGEYFYKDEVMRYRAETNIPNIPIFVRNDWTNNSFVSKRIFVERIFD